MRARLDAAYAGIDAFLGVNLTEQTALIRAKIRGLMSGYDARWRNAPYLVDTVEQVVTSHLWNPETGRRSRSFTLAGKKDANLFYGERRVLMDHKTTSDDISDPAGPYWRQLIIEGQPTHYAMLDWLNGNKVDDIVWDVTRKPQIAPKALSRADATKAMMTGTYCGRDLSSMSLEALAANGREDMEMYEARVAWDCTSDRPERYFQRRSVPRLDADIVEWATELWGHSQDILIARRENRWPRNAGACMNYGRPCKFLGICSGCDTPESDNWRRREWTHPELPVIGDGDKRDVLTNSCIRTFQTCRKQYYFKHELGLERAEGDDAESLYFGSCFHAALEAWFLALKGEQSDSNDATGVSVSGIESADANKAPVSL